METPQTWYIVKQKTGTCDILAHSQIPPEKDPAFVDKWGPYPSMEEAIAKRVGLIRAGKCQPQ